MEADVCVRTEVWGQAMTHRNNERSLSCCPCPSSAQEGPDTRAHVHAHSTHIRGRIGLWSCCDSPAHWHLGHCLGDGPARLPLHVTAHLAISESLCRLSGPRLAHVNSPGLQNLLRRARPSSQRGSHQPRQACPSPCTNTPPFAVN